MLRRPSSGVRLPGWGPGRILQRAAAALLGALLVATPLAAQKRAGADVCPANAGTRAVCVERLAVVYGVLRSGDVMVTESLTVRFDGEWNGYERILVERAARAEGGYRDVHIEMLGATDARGRDLRTETDRSGDEIRYRMWVPGAHDATHTIVLRYTIEDGVTFFDDHDEFYWNAWSGAGTSPVAELAVRVIAPEGATNVRAEAVEGTAGTRGGQVSARVDGAVVDAATSAPLRPGSGFTIVVGWDRGLVERPTRAQLLLLWLARNWSFAVPVLAFALMWSTWSRRGRDPEMLPISVRYEPPPGITPGEMGTLLDERADMRDVTATIVDLAVQGRLRIEEVEGTKVLGFEFGEDYRFVETPPAEPTQPLKPHEQKLLSALFAGRGSVELSDLKNEFYKDLPEIREAMMGSLVAQGVYTSRPDRARAFWLAVAIVSGIALFFGLGFIGATSPLALVAVPPLTVLPILVFGMLMPARTVKGTRLIERLRGFREFLARVDGDRLRRMRIEPSAFERMLPYAMALGVERKFAEAFEGLAHEPPNWYRSSRGGVFHPAVFAADLGRMSTATASSMASKPGGSGGGSGFGGGVSVGGGGGGGGGGGF